MVCRLFDAKSLSKSVLAYCYWTLGNRFHWNLNRNSTVFIRVMNSNTVCGNIDVEYLGEICDTHSCSVMSFESKFNNLHTSNEVELNVVKYWCWTYWCEVCYRHSITFRPLFSNRYNTYISIKHRKTTNYPMYSIKLITFQALSFSLVLPIVGFHFH